MKWTKRAGVSLLLLLLSCAVAPLTAYAQEAGNSGDTSAQTTARNSQSADKVIGDDAQSSEHEDWSDNWWKLDISISGDNQRDNESPQADSLRSDQQSGQPASNRVDVNLSFSSDGWWETAKHQVEQVEESLTGDPQEEDQQYDEEQAVELHTAPQQVNDQQVSDPRDESIDDYSTDSWWDWF